MKKIMQMIRAIMSRMKEVTKWIWVGGKEVAITVMEHVQDVAVTAGHAVTETVKLPFRAVSKVAGLFKSGPSGGSGIPAPQPVDPAGAIKAARATLKEATAAAKEGNAAVVEAAKAEAAKAAAAAPPDGGLAALTRAVREHATALLSGREEVDPVYDLPPAIEGWLYGMDAAELLRVARATSVALEAHLTGDASITGVRPLSTKPTAPPATLATATPKAAEPAVAVPMDEALADAYGVLKAVMDKQGAAAQATLAATSVRHDSIEVMDIDSLEPAEETKAPPPGRAEDVVKAVLKAHAREAIAERISAVRAKSAEEQDDEDLALMTPVPARGR